jgi:hypothetical protein
MKTPAKLPTGPRNLAVPLAAWLRRLGFTALESEPAGTHLTQLTAQWHSPLGHFKVEYMHCHPPQAPAWAGFRLLWREPKPFSLTRELVSMANVNRLKEARVLLLSNKCYDTARQAALLAGTLLPAHCQSTVQP